MKHGHARRGIISRTYYSWKRMKRRCYGRNHINFCNYGGRGIQVCARWFDFSNFLNDMGERPHGMTLDRIDPSGHYMPSNCRWASPKQQISNRRQKAPVDQCRLSPLQGEDGGSRPTQALSVSNELFSQ
jgi:hypothetical protein